MTRRKADRPEHEGPSLLKIVLLGTLGALILGGILGQTFAWMIAEQATPGNVSWLRPWSKLNSAQLYDVVRSDIAAVALVGAGGAALIAYRRQRTAEASHRVAEAQQRIAEGQHRLELQRQALAEGVDLRQRYATAAEQLGHEKAAVRLAGMYALADLADDWSRRGDRAQRQVCVDVLCAYLRMSRTDGGGKEEAEVRSTALGVLRQHLVDPEDPASWCDSDIDLSRTSLAGAIFSEATFKGNVRFWGTTFTAYYSFRGARFLGDLVGFTGANFQEGAKFSKTEFACRIVTFNNMQAPGVDFSRSTWKCPDGVDFSGAQFRGMARFSSAKFDSSVYFDAATFNGESTFRGATFSGEEVSFKKATFDRSPQFNGAAFDTESAYLNELVLNNGSSMDLTRTSKWTADLNGKTPEGVRLP